MQLSRRRFLVYVPLILGSVSVVVGYPAQAQLVQVAPTTPRLGDTIAVVMPVDSAMSTPPTVRFSNKTYPAYEVSGNRWRSLVPTTPLDKAGTKPMQILAGEQVIQTLSIQLRDRSFPVQRIWLPPGKDDLGSDQEFDRVDAFKKLQTPQKYWQGKFLRPNQGPTTSGYGIRRYYNGVFAKDYYHRGVDYAGGYGSPIVAPAGGQVALVGRVSQGFELHGNTVGIDHGQGVLSIFIHLSRIDVKEGDRVKPGQVIGAIGSTGAATGPHLHWGLYVNGLCVDPVPWREQGFE
jgi:murein DD-endopeptidase MepM/ murein hydrolase activator NlpD